MATVTTVSYVGTQHGLTTNETPIDMTRKRMSALVPLTPLTSVSARMTSKKAKTYKPEVIQTSEMPIRATVATTEASAGTTVTITDAEVAKSIRADSIIYNLRRNDHRSVDSQPTTAAITVTISAAGSTSSAWVAGDELLIFNPNLPENDETIRRASPQDTYDYNHIQLTKIHYGLTRIEHASHTHFGGPGEKRKSLREAAHREFRLKSELSFMFGGRGSSGSGAAMTYNMGGLNYFLRDGDLARDFGGAPTWGAVKRWFGDYADLNPDKDRVTFATSRKAIQQICDYGNDKLMLTPSDKSKTFGLQIDKVKIAGLQVDLLPLPLLTGRDTSGVGWIMDWDSLWFKNLEPLMYYPDIKGVGESEILTDCYREVTSMLVANKSRFAMATGLTPESAS